MATPGPSKKLRLKDAADEATDGSERPTRSGEAAMAVLTDEALLQHVTEFQDGLPMLLHPRLRSSDSWVSSSMQKEFRRNGLEHAGLAGGNSVFVFSRNNEQRDALEDLKRANKSYMEMMLDGYEELSLPLLYNMHKDGFSSDHPRLGFQRPMRVAAARGCLTTMEWLSELEEGETWLNDPWLLQYAIESRESCMVDWVYEKCTGDVRERLIPTNILASCQNVEILDRVMKENAHVVLSKNVMDCAADAEYSGLLEYLHNERTEGCTTAAMNKAAAAGNFSIVEFLHENRQEGCTTQAMDDAAVNGRVDVMKFLHDHRSEGFTEKALDQAVNANSGRFGCMMTVERLLSYDAECTEVSLASAFSRGRSNLLKCLHDEFGCDGECIGAADIEACNANSHTIEFVCMYHPDDILADEFIQVNSYIRHLKMIELLEKHKIEGWSASVMDYVAA